MIIFRNSSDLFIMLGSSEEIVFKFYGSLSC